MKWHHFRMTPKRLELLESKSYSSHFLFQIGLFQQSSQPYGDATYSIITHIFSSAFYKLQWFESNHFWCSLNFIVPYVIFTLTFPLINFEYSFQFSFKKCTQINPPTLRPSIVISRILTLRNEQTKNFLTAKSCQPNLDTNPALKCIYVS